MERELWPLLYRWLQETAKEFHPKCVQVQPGVVTAVFLGAALHDRPVSWACQIVIRHFAGVCKRSTNKS
jgi:hypothetical protein